MSVGVIIVAAGRGARLGSSVPKQLLDLGGRTILQRSVQAFDGHPDVGELIVVLPAELLADAPAMIGETARPCRSVAGGARRQDSVRAGVEALSTGVDLVLVHDAARPFVDAGVIDRVVAAARDAGAAIPALPVRDTVKRIDAAAATITETLPREEVWLAQTPQGFRKDLLQTIVRLGEGVEATDEAMLAERAGHRVRVVTGDIRNVKITTADDLAAARAALSPAQRVGTGYDLHRLGPGRPLVLAGVTISTDRGPESHSDGDVLCHALIDALLGASGLGDIGRLFPNSDPAWKDSAGLDLLARTMAALTEQGWRVSNVDVTVVLERPRLGPHVDAMRANLAGVLDVAVGCVSVKAKTNEQVDAVGRGEAIAAQAVVMLTAGRA